MNIDHRNPRLRRGFAFVALAAVLGLSAVGLTQCRMVDDTVTGVDLKSNPGLSARSACVRQCNEAAKQCKKQESIRHKLAKRACGHDAACRKAESRRHKEAKKECSRRKKLCKRNCYNEGAGSAGR